MWVVHFDINKYEVVQCILWPGNASHIQTPGNKWLWRCRTFTLKLNVLYLLHLSNLLVLSLWGHTCICVFSAFLRLHLQRSWVKVKCRGHGREYVTYSNSITPILTSQNVQWFFAPASYKVMAESSQYYLIAIPSVDMHKKRPEESQDLKIEVEKGRLRLQQLCGKEEWCVSYHMRSGDVSTLSNLTHTNYCISETNNYFLVW